MYLIFDIETITDDELVYTSNRESTGVDAAGKLIWEPRAACIKRVLDDVCRKTEDGKSCFIPEKYQTPVVISLLLIGPKGEYITHAAMDARGDNGTRRLVEWFWNCMQNPPVEAKYWVSFNGKKFDGPVMTHWAMRLGVPIPKWLPGLNAKPWEDPRNEILSSPHIDLIHQLAGSKFVAGGAGSMSYWARTFGLPGKSGVSGDKVAEMWAAGRDDEIKDYCLTDCLNTAGILLGFLRAQGHAVDPRSKEFETTMLRVLDSRPGSKVMEAFWRAYGPTLPF